MAWAVMPLVQSSSRSFDLTQKTLNATGMAVLILLSPLCGLGAEKRGMVGGRGSITNDFVKKDGKISLIERRRTGSADSSHDQAASVADVMKGLSDDTVFVKIGDSDILTWGTLRTHADSLLKVKADSILGEAGSNERNLRLSLYGAGLAKILRSYIGAAVVAYDARKKGLVLSEKEFSDERSKLMSLVSNPSIFQNQYVTNSAYMRAYIDKYLRPTVKASEEDVAKLIDKRHRTNLSVPMTNRLFRATLEGVRAKIVNNEISFGDAVDEYSECVNCSSNGGDCGTWEEDEDSLDPALKSVCFSIPTNQVSEVIETPEAFHLVKITSRYVPTAKAREEDGEVSSVDVLHIQIDKWQVDPEFTKDSARKYLEDRMLKRALKRRQLELIETTPIESVIPLKGSRRRKKPIVLKGGKML